MNLTRRFCVHLYPTTSKTTFRGFSSESRSNRLVDKSYPDFECRTSFEIENDFKHPIWFPPHMSGQFKKMEGKLKAVDLIIEVRFAF